VYAVTATSHHLHGPGCSRRSRAVSRPGFRHSIIPNRPRVSSNYSNGIIQPGHRELTS